MGESINYKELRFYRPNNNRTGSASRLQSRKDEDKLFLFWEATLQTGVDANGNASFAWKDKSKCITLKLGEVDIGELLAVLNGIKPNVGGEKGIFHKNKTGNTSFQFQRSEKGYYFRLATKKGEVLFEIKKMLSFGEGELVRVYLEQYLHRYYNL